MDNNVTVALVQLGCEKNLLDAEQMLHSIGEAGYTLVAHEGEAQVIIVNTCCFIEAAEQEAIDTILEMAEYKRDGTCRRLIVSGCLAQKRKEEIMAEIPEVDCIVGVGGYGDIVSAIEGGTAYADKPYALHDGGRYISTPPYVSYIKVADGCDNRCSYCVIPDIRGPYQSRPIESIVAEARDLAEGGTTELILIAQDTTRYGSDLYGEPKLIELLTELLKINGLHWIRLHYLYPERITDALIDFIASNPRICRYIDMPLQHCNDGILRAMGRRGDKAYITALIRTLREKLPEVTLRTSLIVGFPGETQEIYDELCDFVRETRFERLGVFAYSEQDTPSAKLPDKVNEETKAERADALMEMQAGIMDELCRARIGQTVEVLCEGYDGDVKQYFGRTQGDSVDVDCKVYFQAKRRIAAGTYINVRVADTIDVDLLGEAAE